MKDTLRILNILTIVLFLMGLLGPAAAPAQLLTSRTHPLLSQIAAQDPAQVVSIIVQKAAGAEQIERVVTKLGGQITYQLNMINAFAARMPAAAALELASHSDVRWVSLDAVMEKTGTSLVTKTTCEPNTNYYPGTTGALALWSSGINGSDIGVAVIDSGISSDADFSAFAARSTFNPNSTSISDVQGHGTHVAGIIAGQGKDSNGKYVGMAPEASLIGLKVSDETGVSYESDVVAALQWVYDNKDKYNIRVVNLSLNSSVEQSYLTSPIDAAVEVLWFDGIVVVVSAGNSGMGYNTINAAPANDPFVITVGATDEKCTTDPDDDTMGEFSMYGTTLDGYAKPDLLAPGYNIVSVLSSHSNWGSQYPERLVDGEYFRLSGTSMAAPIVSGAVALLLQSRPDLTPNQVKYILKTASGTIKLNRGPSFPYLNASKAFRALSSGNIKSANAGIQVNNLLTNGSEPVFDTVSWNSVSWNSVSWNSVSWNSVSWNSVYWGD